MVGLMFPQTVRERPLKIAITGRFRRGKDTLADLIEEFIAGDGPVARLAFARALKAELAEMTLHYTNPPDLVIPGKKVPKMFMVPGGYKMWEDRMNERRDINGVGWQWWGEWRRQICGEDYWIKHPLFRAAHDEATQARKHILVTDMRHHNEAEWCGNNGFYRVRVTGPCRAPDDVRDKDHPSETAIEHLPVDCVYDNVGSVLDMQEWVRLVLVPTVHSLQHTA